MGTGKVRTIMKKFRDCLLLAFFVATASYGLVWASCAIDPKGSCAILGFNPVQPTANRDVVTNGDNPDDPLDSGSGAPLF